MVGRSQKLFALLLALSVLLAACSSRLPLERAPLPFRQAEDSFKLGHYERAAHGYRIFIDSGDTPELLPRAYFKLAQSEFRLGKHDRCIATLDELEHRYPGDEWRQVHELRGDAEYARGNPVSAVLRWEEALEVAEAARRPVIRRRISDAVSRMDGDMLMSTRAVISTSEVREMIDAALVAGPPSAPLRPTPVAAAPAARRQTPAPLGAAPEVEADKARIGVLLPLSGKYAVYGERSLAGIRLAFADTPTQLVVRDTEGVPQVARAAIDQLIQDPTVVAVLGPLRSKVAETVTARAERAGLPLLSLAQRKTIEGRYVVQTAMTREWQAAQIASYATTAGMRRFGVLYPRDAYGNGLSEAFQSEVRSRGGVIVGALAYEPGTAEFSVEVVTLQRWIDADRLEAVFIPDYVPTAGVLASALRDARPGVMLLGANGWNDAGKLGSFAGALDGAVFVDGFFMGSQRPATQSFIARYRGEHGDMPRILEAQAYDAAHMVGSVLSAAKPVSRDTFVPELRGLGVVQGAAGDIRVTDSGVDRGLFVLKLEGQRIREVRQRQLRSYAAPPTPAPTPALR